MAPSSCEVTADETSDHTLLILLETENDHKRSKRLDKIEMVSPTSSFKTALESPSDVASAKLSYFSIDDDDKNDSASDAGSAAKSWNSGYDQEPWETYQHKVVALATEFGDVENVRVERVKGGGYNRVTKLSFNLGDRLVQGVIRRSRAEWEEGDDEEEISSELLDQIAMLQFLTSHGITVPAIIAYDATMKNSLKSPYIFQELLKGQCLEGLYYNLSFKEKLSIADEVAKFLLSLEKIKFPEAGQFIAEMGPDTPHKVNYLVPGNHSDLEFKMRGLPIWGQHGDMHGPLATNLEEFLTGQIDRWCICQKHDYWFPYGKLDRIWKDMKKFDWLTETTARYSHGIFHHWDLTPRNIFVQRSTEYPQRWVITSVIDWDDVKSLPPVLARRPPQWLWTNHDLLEHKSDWIEDFDWLPSGKYGGKDCPLLWPEQQLKNRFNSKMAEGLAKIHTVANMATFMDETYEQGHFVRRLATYAMRIIADKGDWERLDMLKEDWSSIRRSLPGAADIKIERDEDGSESEDSWSDDEEGSNYSTIESEKGEDAANDIGDGSGLENSDGSRDERPNKCDDYADEHEQSKDAIILLND